MTFGMAGRCTIIKRIDIWRRILYYDDVRVIFISRCSTETRKIRSKLKGSKLHRGTHCRSEANVSEFHAGRVNLVAMVVEQKVGAEVSVTAFPKEGVASGTTVPNTFTSINSTNDGDRIKKIALFTVTV